MSMYTKDYVVTIWVGGKLQRETQDGVVTIPYGSEYVIRLKNKHNRRALAKVSIDGKNISDGGFIIGANSHLDLERPVDIDKKFLFCHIDSDVAWDQGINKFKPDSQTGLIEVKFSLEVEEKCYKIRDDDQWEEPSPWQKPYKPYKPYRYDSICKSYSMGGQSLGASGTVNGLMPGEFNCRGSVTSSLDSCYLDSNFSELSEFDKAGVTAEGSDSSQTFRYASFEAESVWTTLKIRLRGYNPDSVESDKPNIKRDLRGRFAPKENNNLDEQLHSLSLEKEKLEKIRDLQKEIEELKALL